MQIYNKNLKQWNLENLQAVFPRPVSPKHIFSILRKCHLCYLKLIILYFSHVEDYSYHIFPICQPLYRTSCPRGNAVDFCWRNAWFESQLRYRLSWLRFFEVPSVPADECRDSTLAKTWTLPSNSLFTYRPSIWRYIDWILKSVIK